jgi:Ser/Thr protein kinase RdoA (MazF antagonist)
MHVLEFVERGLQGWSGSIRLLTEVQYENRASRAWYAQSDDADLVVKLAFDGPSYVEPGLRVANHVQGCTGIMTGVAVPDLRGRLAVPLRFGVGSVCSLAVLERVHGEPVDVFGPDLAGTAGSVLARVHVSLMVDAPAVPGSVLQWFRGRAKDSHVREALAGLDGMPFTSSVLYGDPSPELLITGDDELAIIDWGTPSFGPVMYDVASWHGHIETHANDGAAAGAFLAAYQAESPVKPAEYGYLDAFACLWRSLTPRT